MRLEGAGLAAAVGSSWAAALTAFLCFHSRHCGRLLCHKCSTKEIPIIKFDLNKPVRVCNICFDVLTLGGVS